MKAFKCFFVGLMALPLLGCPAPKYLAQPEPVLADGIYTHSPSNLSFPLSVGDFKRGTVQRYDEDGLDVSVEYNLDAHSDGVAVTVYVYPSPPIVSINSPADVVAAARSISTQREFETRKQEIEGVHPGAALIQEQDVALRRTGYSGKTAIFEFQGVFAGQRQMLRSHLYIFCYVRGQWTVKYRVTYPKGYDATKEIEQILQEVPMGVPDDRNFPFVSKS